MQSLAHLLAAMAPCSRLYGYLGCQLRRARPGAGHQYARWARTYSSASYLAMVSDKEKLLNRVGRRVPNGAPLLHPGTAMGVGSLQCAHITP